MKYITRRMVQAWTAWAVLLVFNSVLYAEMDWHWGGAFILNAIELIIFLALFKVEKS